MHALKVLFLSFDTQAGGVGCERLHGKQQTTHRSGKWTWRVLHGFDKRNISPLLSESSYSLSCGRSERKAVEKRFSAFKNHFFKLPAPLSPQKDGKTILGKQKLFFSIPPNPPPPENDEKTIFGWRKSLFQSLDPLPRHQLWRNGKKNQPSPPSCRGTNSRECWKNDFRPAKISFWSPLTPQGTSSKERWEHDFQPAKITFSSFLKHLLPQGTSSGGRSGKSDCGHRKSLFQAPESIFGQERTIFAKPKASKSGHMLGIHVNLNVLFSSLSFCPKIKLKDVPILNANSPTFLTTTSWENHGKRHGK